MKKNQYSMTKIEHSIENPKFNENSIFQQNFKFYRNSNIQWKPQHVQYS